jgi:tetratricopeptide (TPR) repeat protein
MIMANNITARGRQRLRRLAGKLVPWLMVGMAVAGCAAPDPTSSPLRLPTRVPLTPTPTPTFTPTPFPFTVRDYYREGVARQEAGDAEGAGQSFTWAIQRAPDYSPAYIARGTAYLAQGKFSMAVADADAALEIDPTSADAYALRGEALRLLGLTQLATAAFDQALELDPDLGALTFRSRWLAAREQHHAIRLQELSGEYTDRHPDDPMRHYYRGWAFLELGSSRAAIRILAKGIEATPEPPAVLWFALGHAYEVANDWQNAVTAFETTRLLVQAGDTSLALHSDQPIVDLFGTLGEAYLRAGRCVDAGTMLEYAIDIGAPALEYEHMLKEAHVCQTPTPTPTPYLTATPG